MTSRAEAAPFTERAARAGGIAISSRTTAWTLVFTAIGAVYLGTRILSWQLNGLLEDHDSVSYLDQIAAFLTFDWQRIDALGPGTTPFYPFFGALFSLPGWSVETGARLTSLAFSCLLFVSLIGIARHIGGLAAGAMGLLLVALNTELIRLSYSVLTEPSFVATIYLGLWLFLEQRDRISLVHAAVLGLILGLAFLNRIEGLIFALAFPLLQCGYTFAVGRGRASAKKLLLWSGVCYLAFLALAGPQVWYVSDKLGQFAINGRQLPASLLHNRPDGFGYERKFYGLDYSPSQTNWEYLTSHPDELAQLSSSFDPVQYIRRSIVNLSVLNHQALGTLIGAAALVFFAVGITGQLHERRYWPPLLVGGFLLIGLAGPILHNVVIRHIAVLAPLALLVAGDGLMRTARGAIRTVGGSRALPYPLALALTAGVVGMSAVPLFRLFLLEDTANNEYRPRDLAPIVAQIEQTAAERPGRPGIVARKTYVAHWVEDSVFFPLPHTDLAGLETYMQMNDAEFLVLRYDFRLMERPFSEDFTDGDPPADFRLLYRSSDSADPRYELYRYETAGSAS